MYQFKHLHVFFVRGGLSFRAFLLALLLVGGMQAATMATAFDPLFARSQHWNVALPDPYDAVSSDLTVTSSTPGGSSFKVGQTFTLSLLVSNTSQAKTFSGLSGLDLGMNFPAGLSHMLVMTHDWANSLSSTDSPAMFSTLYTGPAVAPGKKFPEILISGILTSAAVPSFTVTPTVLDRHNVGVVRDVLKVNVAPGPEDPNALPINKPQAHSLTSPNVSVDAHVVGGPLFHVGQSVRIDLTATNSDAQVALGAGAAVSLTDVFPLGLDNLSAVGGSDWSINASSVTGPMLFTAVYTGAPIAAGAAFPAISVTATLTQDAVPTLENLTNVFDNQFQGANSASTQITVLPATSTSSAASSGQGDISER